MEFNLSHICPYIGNHPATMLFGAADAAERPGTPLIWLRRKFPRPRRVLNFCLCCHLCSPPVPSCLPKLDTQTTPAPALPVRGGSPHVPRIESCANAEAGLR